MAPNEYRRAGHHPPAARAVRKNIRQDYAGRFEYNVAIERSIADQIVIKNKKKNETKK